jgi:hypothetical protein
MADVGGGAGGREVINPRRSLRSTITRSPTRLVVVIKAETQSSKDDDATRSISPEPMQRGYADSGGEGKQQCN